MEALDKDLLIRKYNVPGPRYTSYPTVPFWDNETFGLEKWEKLIVEKFSENWEEISVYIHLPYCESLCTFCGCNTRITVNHAVEAPYIDAVLKEWNLYLSKMKFKPVIKELHLGGGTPTFFSAKQLERLILGITANVILCPDAELGFEGHPNNTTPLHLQTLYDLGFRRVSFGIQDFDPKVQEAINRIQSFDKVKEVTQEARSIGYTSINFDIVYGLPLQTLSSISDTIDKVKELRPDRIAFYSYAHVPWIKPGQRKFTELDLPDDEEKRALYEYGLKELEEAGYVEIGMDHFALPSDVLYHAAMNKTLHRNFMGYTTQRTATLIGLGVSAISDIGEAYAQNVKTVEEYIARIDHHILPVFRGHFLNKEDAVMKKHILNVMCKQETSWEGTNESCMSLFNALLNMEELEKDGLIETEYFSLKVTPLGKKFIRNVCMALDTYLQAKGKSVVQFSKVI
ncbi:MAG: hemN [Chitinophagaceae bacterium]|nr:hemN [Chitinophagaceae bacterium]